MLGDIDMLLELKPITCQSMDSDGPQEPLAMYQVDSLDQLTEITQ